MKDFDIIISISAWGEDEDEALGNVENVLDFIKEHIGAEYYAVKIEEVGTTE